MKILRANTRGLRQFSLALSLLVFAAAIGDLGHARSGASWHGPETTSVSSQLDPLSPDHPDSRSPGVTADCPLCNIGRTLNTGVTATLACSSAFRQRFHAVFSYQVTPVRSPHRCTDPARAPPARFSA